MPDLEPNSDHELIYLPLSPASPPTTRRRKTVPITYTSKPCTRCKADKPLGEFPPASRYRDGRKSRCRECTRENDNERRENESVKEYYKNTCKRWRESEHGRLYTRIYRRKYKAMLRLESRRGRLSPVVVDQLKEKISRCEKELSELCDGGRRRMPARGAPAPSSNARDARRGTWGPAIALASANGALRGGSPQLDAGPSEPDIELRMKAARDARTAKVRKGLSPDLTSEELEEVLNGT